MEIEDCIGMIAMQKVCVAEAEELLAQGKGNREQLEKVVQDVTREILPSTERGRVLRFKSPPRSPS